MNGALNTELRKEAERIEEDALYSGKGHYNAIAPWRWTHRFLGILAAVGSTVAAAAILREWGHSFAISAAAISTIAAVVLTAMKPSEEADRHQRAGDRYFGVKNRARIFRNIELNGANASEDSLIEEVKSISAALDEIRASAPTIPPRAYSRAKHDVEVAHTGRYQVDNTQ